MNTENMTATEVLEVGDRALREARIMAHLNTLGETLERLRAKIDNARRLEWTEDTHEAGGFWAQTPFGRYRVRPYMGDVADESPWVAFLLDGFDGRAPTADGAMAYAERDWARRVDALLGGAL